MIGLRVLHAADVAGYLNGLPRAVAEGMKPALMRAAILVQAAVKRHASGLSVGKGTAIAPSRGKLAQSYQISGLEVKGFTDAKVSVGSNLAYAAIHEFGGTIRPRNARYLTIPVSPVSVRRRARDFKDSFFLNSKGGDLLLARRAGGVRSARIELLYVLKRQVNIKSRRYVTNALKDAEPGLEPILGQSITAALAGN